MIVKLKNERTISYIDADGESKSITLKADRTVEISIVTGRLAREYEIFKPYVGKLFIDLDSLNLGECCLPVCIEDLILNAGDYEADIAESVRKLCEYL